MDLCGECCCRTATQSQQDRSGRRSESYNTFFIIYEEKGPVRMNEEGCEFDSETVDVHGSIVVLSFA